LQFLNSASGTEIIVPNKAALQAAGSVYDKSLAELPVVASFFIAAVERQSLRGANRNPEEDAVTHQRQARFIGRVTDDSERQAC
jgi:hypothetical protein